MVSFLVIVLSGLRFLSDHNFRLAGCVGTGVRVPAGRPAALSLRVGKVPCSSTVISISVFMING